MCRAAEILFFLIAIAASPSLVQCCFRPGPSQEDVELLRQDVAALKRNVKHLEVQHENLMDAVGRQYTGVDTNLPSTELTNQLQALKITVDELLLKQNQLSQLVDTIEPKKQKVLKDTVDRLETQLNDKTEKMTKYLKVMEEKSNRQNDDYRDEFNKIDSTIKNKVEEFVAKLKDMGDTTQRNFSLVQESLESLNAVVNTELKKEVAEFSEHISMIRKAKDEIDVILSQVQQNVDRIVPNTFNKDALIMAIMIVVVMVFLLGFFVHRLNQKVEEIKKYQ